MKILPLIGYIKSEPEDTSYPGAIDEYVRRYWTLVKYRRAPDPGVKERDWQTAEFCFKTRNVFDFCGGQYVYSPQIKHYQRGQWRESGFCNPGSLPTLGSLGWEVLEDEPDRAVDLAEYTGQEYWTNTEVSEYGTLCIAAAALGHLVSSGTAGWISTDTTHGPMARVHELMCEWSGKVVSQQPVFVSSVTSKYPGNACATRIETTEVKARDNSGEQFHNSNSGNEVKVFHGVWEYASGDNETRFIDCENCGEEVDLHHRDECHECGYDATERVRGLEVLEGQMLRTYNNAKFVQQVRRYDWSNG